MAVAQDAKGESDDVPLAGATLDEATAAALAETGGGTVTETEQEDGVYEVEVTLDDGTEVEVELDGDFEVVATETDDDEADDADQDEADEADDADDADEADGGSEGDEGTSEAGA